MTNFYYDPKRQGYEASLWKTLAGTPTVASDKIVLSAAEIIGYGDLTSCDLKMRLIIPAVPTAGDVRQFGLASVGFGAFVVFDITDDTFNIHSDDGNGNTQTVEVEFNSAWATAATDFEIKWRGSYADFLVNGVKVIDLTDTTIGSYRLGSVDGKAMIPNGPLSIYVKNDNVDNLEIVSINARNIQSFI